MLKKIIGVSGSSLAGPYQFLFRALAQSYPLVFRPVLGGEFAGLDGVLVLDGDEENGRAAAVEGIPSYVAGLRGRHSGAAGRCDIEFGNSSSLDTFLRRQSMIDRAGPSGPLALQPGDEIMAKQNGQPIWISRPSGGAACQIVSGLPPALQEGEFLFQYINGRRFLGLLPLLNFLRQLVADVDWQAPSLRACFIFDDPSLYRPSYGYLNYRLLAEHARKHGYFVSIATVPLDSWFVNGEVAETFRACSPRLSLVIHGNNHLPGELLGANEGGLASAAQALCRMERLQHTHSIPYLKIMEAPHGALAQGMFDVLLSLGYEAALCTPELLVLHNPNTRWPATIGLEQSEILGGGLPVIPRIKMSPDWKNEVLLKAFLRQPIIIAGHHTDVAGGMELLADLAKMIRRLGGVTWSDLQGVLRANYLQKIEGNTLRVKMYSRRVRVPIPNGIKHLSVERPWIEPNCTEKLIISTGRITRICHDAGKRVDELPLSGELAEVTSEFSNELPYWAVAPPRLSPWSISRKVLMEVRDRLSPVLPIVNHYR
jgi:hypothetical protein